MEIIGFVSAFFFACLFFAESRLTRAAQRNCEAAIKTGRELLDINDRANKSCREAIAICGEWERMFNELKTIKGAQSTHE